MLTRFLSIVILVMTLSGCFGESKSAEPPPSNAAVEALLAKVVAAHPELHFVALEHAGGYASHVSPGFEENCKYRTMGFRGDFSTQELPVIASILALAADHDIKLWVVVHPTLYCLHINRADAKTLNDSTLLTPIRIN